jgi:dTDP-4-dehydrorhamnose reductase
MAEPFPVKKLLVTGASGFLGWNICSRAVSRYRVFGVYNSHSCDIGKVVPVHCDLTLGTELEKLFSEIRPDAVIHAAAAADPNYCQTHPEESKTINVTASVNIARQCAAYGIPCVFTSSDLVFDGTKPPYRENDPVCPLSLYGEQKAEAERTILAEYSNATVCRMPLMYGDAPLYAKSFIHPLVAALKSGTTLSLFTDEFRTPVGATDAADGLFLAIAKESQGILHLGGPERLSRFAIGQCLAKALGITPCIEPIMQKAIKMAAPRAADVSLESTKAHMLGFHPKTMAATLQELNVIKMLHRNSVQKTV